jgi:hypothetical protein
MGSTVGGHGDHEMERFIQNENIVRFRKLIAITEGDPSRDEVRYRMLLRLLAEEQSKSQAISR